MENLNIVKTENSKNCVWWSCYANAKYEFYWEINTDSILVTKKRSNGLVVEFKLYPDKKINAASVRTCINRFLKEI